MRHVHHIHGCSDLSLLLLPSVKHGENGEKEARRFFGGNFGTTKVTKVHEKGFCGLSLCVSASLWEIKSNTPIRVHLIFVPFHVFRGY